MAEEVEEGEVIKSANDTESLPREHPEQPRPARVETRNSGLRDMARTDLDWMTYSEQFQNTLIRLATTRLCARERVHV